MHRNKKRKLCMAITVFAVFILLIFFGHFYIKDGSFLISDFELFGHSTVDTNGEYELGAVSLACDNLHISKNDWLVFSTVKIACDVEYKDFSDIDSAAIYRMKNGSYAIADGKYLYVMNDNSLTAQSAFLCDNTVRMTEYNNKLIISYRGKMYEWDYEQDGSISDFTDISLPADVRIFSNGEKLAFLQNNILNILDSGQIKEKALTEGYRLLGFDSENTLIIGRSFGIFLFLSKIDSETMKKSFIGFTDFLEYTLCGDIYEGSVTDESGRYLLCAIDLDMLKPWYVIIDLKTMKKIYLSLYPEGADYRPEYHCELQFIQTRK